MTAAEAPRCTAYWHDGRMSGPCPRPAKEDGLCGAHLAGRRRSEQARTAYREQEHARAAKQKEGDALAAALTAKLGVPVTYYIGLDGRSEELALNVREARAWLEAQP